MADDVVVLAPDSTGKKADMSSLTVGANTVYRQRMNLADPTVAAALALVMNSAPAGTEYGLVVRQAGPIGALAAGSAIIGKVTTDQTTHGTSDLVAADLYVGGHPNSATYPVQTSQPDATATGTLSAAQASLTATSTAIAGSCVVLALGSGQTTLSINLAGTLTTSTIVVDGSIDPSTSTTSWVPLPFSAYGFLNAAVLSLTLASAAVALDTVCSGLAQVRIRMVAKAGSDSITVLARASIAQDAPPSEATVPAVNVNVSGASALLCPTSGLMDVSTYRWVSVQISSYASWSGISFQGSNDGVNWQNILLYSATVAASAPVSTVWAAGLWHGPLAYRYFQVIVTAWSSGGTSTGNYNGAVLLSTAPAASTNLATTDVVTGNITSGTADGGSAPVKIGAIYNTTQPSVTPGQRVDLQATTHGAQIVATGADPFSVNTPFSQADPNDAHVVGDTSLTSPDQSGTATVTTKSGSASDQVLIVANARSGTIGSSPLLGRRGLIIANTATASWLYLSYGTAAKLSATPSWCARIAAGSTWSMPSPLYNGAVHGIWDSSVNTGADYAVMTELT